MLTFLDFVRRFKKFVLEWGCNLTSYNMYIGGIFYEKDYEKSGNYGYVVIDGGRFCFYINCMW